MDDTSAVSLLQQILDDAYRLRSTDVHLRVGPSEWTVHFRIAGQVHPYLRGDRYGPEVVRRVKALARMDVAESRLPQDGSFQWRSEAASCDVRVASIPTVYGEAMVLRLLPSANDMLAFPALGMSPEQTEQMRSILQNPSGLVLVAGATGAGKTTTLYSMMLQLSRWGRRVVSIEDPVEMALPDCHQVQVRERIGVTFEAGLKALLRQDPDVIMVGEIRDDATARVALRAAMSGHLVLSTTHAQDLVGAVARLVEFGLNRALVGDVLRAVIVQELHLRPCRDCDGAGCRLCAGTGWDKERRARFAIHPMSVSMTQLLASDRSWVDIRRELAVDRQRSG